MQLVVALHRLAGVQLSVCLDSGRPWQELAQLALHADVLGLHRIYVCDHFMPHRPDGGPAPGPVLEAWSTLAALAATTDRIGIGSLVLGATYRHPAVVANMAATLDHISGGRLVLGLGAGWQPNEHAAYGIPLPVVRQRLARFEEGCRLIRSMLNGEAPTFTGAHYRTVQARCEPAPLQSPLPLLVGGGGETHTLRIAAEVGDEWHSWTDPTAFRHKSSVLDEHCSNVGRDPQSIRRLTGQSVYVTTAASESAAPDIVGPPAYVAEQLAAYRTAGVDEFVIRDHSRTPPAEAADQLSQLISDVLPLLVPT